MARRGAEILLQIKLEIVEIPSVAFDRESDSDNRLIQANRNQWTLAGNRNLPAMDSDEKTKRVGGSSSFKVFERNPEFPPWDAMGFLLFVYSS